MLAHNAEEGLTMGRFLDAHRELLPGLLRAMTGERFAVSLAVATLVGLVAAAGAARRPQGAWLLLFIALQATMGVNALQHVGMALYLRSYAPGVVTAAALYLPYSLALVGGALRAEWVAARPLALASLALIALMPGFLVAAHLLSQAALGHAG
jgi:hypothetical protein